MKTLKLFTLVLVATLCLFSTQLNAQVSCSDCPLSFSENVNANGLIFASIEVQTNGPDDLSLNALESVCIELDHSYLSDVFVSLISPDGVNYMLMGDNDNNADGCDFTSNSDATICFVPGTDNPLTTGDSYENYCGTGPGCLTGDWNLTCGTLATSDLFPETGPAPNCDLADFNQAGNTVSGTWTIVVACVCMLELQAFVVDWSLSFNDNSVVSTGNDPPNPLQLVYPGDFNADGTASSRDLIYFGMAYDLEGPVRANASNAFEPQACEDWDYNTPFSSVNYKNMDADGNGIVNMDDLVVMESNMGETYSNSYNSSYLPNDLSTEMIPLTIEVPTEPLTIGQSYNFPIMLGSATDPVENLQGLQFGMTTNFASVSFDYENSFLGELNEDFVAMDQQGPNDSDKLITIAKLGQTAINGYGQIATLNVTDIDAFNQYFLFFAQKQGITIDETIKDLFLPDVAINFETTTVTTNNPLPDNWAYFPTPANEYLQLNTPGTVLETITIQNLNGQTMMTFAPQEESIYLDTKELAQGIYLMQLTNGENHWVEKIVIGR